MRTHSSRTLSPATGPPPGAGAVPVTEVAHGKKIHILMLEDRSADAELEMRELRREGILFTAKRVWTEADFHAELQNSAPDLILADNSLPGYDGLSALKLARQERPEVPFLFVSGTIGEEVAINALHHGATDYVLKQRLPRLGPAVRRALADAAKAAELNRAERLTVILVTHDLAVAARYGTHLALVHDGVLKVDLWGGHRDAPTSA